jgi:ABC-type sugar transport system ATPase subunit
MLEIRNIFVKAGEFMLCDISLKISEGEYHALIGPSGSGKTLLLNTIAGFQKTIKGSILYNNNEIQHLSPEKRNISYLFQDLALFPHLNVYNNIAFPLKIRGVNKVDIDKTVKEYLDFTHITHLINRSISNLSGGEKQRVALARILVTGSPFIMLDEPFSAIDTQLQPELIILLSRISLLGKAIIHVTHNFNEIEGLAKNVTVMDKGAIIQSGRLENLVSNPVNTFVAGFSNPRIKPKGLS